MQGSESTIKEACILSQDSAMRKALALIADKWTILVVFSLESGSKRLSQMQREIEGISQKMLIQTLRNMERNGLVERTVYPVMPPKVEYRLTQLGVSLQKIRQALCDWADENMAELDAFRARNSSEAEPGN
ncbi:helix-turn-helix transcriptional regulator [Pleurocapsales cyanobacterium LEGE 06147]|nr:helix-turn-helix transcriptional regulator [Pleurocapsales cyanobacterium LEGE 06147]